MKRQIIICDRCEKSADAVEVGPFDLGNGPKSLDLCSDCQVALNIPTIIALATEYGTPLVDKGKSNGNGNGSKLGRPRTSGEPDQRYVRECPVCGQALANRSNGIVHLKGVHGMTDVEASKALPPIGGGVPCEHCGFLASVRGGGLAAHISAAHPEQEASVA